MTDKSKQEKKENQSYSFVEAVQYFKNNGVKIAKGISSDVIIKLESKIDFKFPDDFKEFHLLSNGFLDWEMDKNCFSIWPFDRIEESYNDTKYTEPDFIPITDYLINCWHYGYIKGKKGIYSDCKTEPIAKNFKDFVNLIIKDSSLLY